MRPEFFSDPTVSRLPADVRLTYIGLWCVADDAGWLVWDEPHIGALLYPYESVRVREKRVERAGAYLHEANRMVFYPCGCAQIPKLPDHQKIGGNKSVQVYERHRVHTSTDKSAGRVGNGSNGTLVAPARAGGAARQDDDDALRAAFARQGLPVERSA